MDFAYIGPLFIGPGGPGLMVVDAQVQFARDTPSQGGSDGVSILVPVGSPARTIEKMLVDAAITKGATTNANFGPYVLTDKDVYVCGVS